MFIGVGVGAYWAGAFHLLTHACFKACLFLGSGSVIHGMHHLTHHREHAHGHGAQRRRESRDLVDGLAADVQRGEERAQLSGRRVARHHRGHRRAGLVAGQRPAGSDDAQSLTRVHRSSPACALHPRS